MTFVKILPSYQSDNKEWHWTESLAMFIHSCSEFVPHYLSQLFHRRLKSTARKSLMDCLRIMSMRWDIFCILEVLSGTLSVSYDDVYCKHQYSVIGILHVSYIMLFIFHPSPGWLEWPGRSTGWKRRKWRSHWWRRLCSRSPRHALKVGKVLESKAHQANTCDDVESLGWFAKLVLQCQPNE